MNNCIGSCFNYLFLTRFTQDRSGVTSIEYAVLASILAVGLATVGPKLLSKSAIASAELVASISTTLSQSDALREARSRFTQLDKNRNGMIDRDEQAQNINVFTSVSYAPRAVDIDENSDEILQRSEWLATAKAYVDNKNKAPSAQ